MSTMQRRHVILAATLLATLAASWLAPDATDDLVLPPPTEKRPASSMVLPSEPATVAASEGASVPLLHLRELAESPLGLFSLPPPLTTS